MNAKELKEWLQKWGGDDSEVVVRFRNPNQIGRSAAANISSIFNGFDWDKGRVIIYTTPELTIVDENLIDQMKAENNKRGAMYLENLRLQSEIRKLKKELDASKNQTK